MNSNEESFLESRKMLGSSSFVHSPSLVRNSSRRPNRTGTLLRTMLDEAVMNQTSMPSTITYQSGSTVNYGKSFQTPIVGDERNQSMFSTTFDLIGQSLLEPKTPAKFNRTSNKTEVDPQNTCETVTNSIFSEFKKSLSDCESSLDVFSLLDSFEEICKEHINLLSTSPSRISSQQEMFIELSNLLSSEQQTWRLVSALYKDRLCDDDDESMKVDLNDSDSVISEKEYIDRFFQSNNIVRQAQIVIDWLEGNAAEELGDIMKKSQRFTNKVCWENSLHSMKNQTKIGTSDLLSEMDPDAPTRTQKPLNDLDIEDENRLLKCIFSCIRAGRIDQAQDLCLTHGHPWRAASLEGWRLYHDPNYNDGGDSNDDVISNTGNPHRKLWKIACWSLSQNNVYSESERAIYGTLCGNLKAMMQVCISWEDSLWAHLKTMVDVECESHIQQHPNLLLPWQHARGEDLCLPDCYWSQRIDQFEEIFDKIDSTYKQVLKDQGKQLYHMVHRCLILNDIDGLLEYSLNELETLNPHMLRFIAHLIFFLRSVGIAMKSEHCDAIISAFVNMLIQNESTGHLVALYTAFLPREMQIGIYSSFLSKIENEEERKEFIQLGEEAGLDIPDIMKEIVEKIKSEGHPDLVDIPMVADDESVPMESNVTEYDRKLISAINWLVFDPSQRGEAIKQCNDVIRIFLAGNKFASAKEALSKIPPDSIATVESEWRLKADKSVPIPPEEDNNIREHLCYQAYVDAQIAFDDWFKQLHRKPVQASTDDSAFFQSSVSISDLVAEEHRLRKHDDNLKSWTERINLLCQSASTKIYNVLLFPGGWLVDRDSNKDKDDRRTQQLLILRKQCIPFLCDLLITVLSKTEGQSGQCSKLADVIAAKENELYLLFTPSSGRRLMRKIQDALVDLL